MYWMERLLFWTWLDDCLLGVIGDGCIVPIAVVGTMPYYGEFPSWTYCRIVGLGITQLLDSDLGAALIWFFITDAV